ncbi:cytochrome c oxidase subunit II [soil metagenome]
MRRGALAALAVGAAGCSSDSNVIDPAGRGAAEIATLWWFLLVPATLVSLLVIGLLLVTARRRRDRPSLGDGPLDEDETADRRWVVWGGVVLPVVVLLPLAALVYVTSQRIAEPPDAGEMVIEVVGHQYWWEVRYPETGAVTANEIHIPVDSKVRIDLSTDDVIHSFWVPSLHGKTDMIPGQDTHIVLEPTRTGEFQGYCAEFCGVQHAGMRFRVIVTEPEDFDAWLARESDDAAPPEGELAERGAEVFGEVGCADCHRVAGSDFDGDVGPDLTHLASRRTLGAGIIANRRGELAGWISDPQGVKPGNLMPPAALDAEDLDALLAYLEGLE